MTLRRLLACHLWSGLTVGLVLTAMAVSGALLAFRPQLEPVLNARFLTVAPAAARLTLDELVIRARAAHPTAELDYVRYFASPTAAVLVRFTNKDFAYLDPHTGTVLGIRNRYEHFFGWLEGFHRFFLLEQKTGERITGSAAVVFVFIILSGIALWWPSSSRALKAGLKFKPGLSGRLRTLNVHKTLGAYAAVVVLTSAVTGVPQAFDWAVSALYTLTGSKEETPPAPLPATTAPFVGMEAVARRLAALVPGARETLIHFPEKGRVHTFSIAADAPHPNARTYAWFAASDGRVLSFVPYAQDSAGRKLAMWLLSVHLGLVGGLTTQFLLFFGALSVPVLVGTGAISYFRRKSNSPKLAATPDFTPQK
jgi:uncharacterized iron-regulated membrane protein